YLLPASVRRNTMRDERFILLEQKFSEAPKNEIDALLHIANMLKVATFLIVSNLEHETALDILNSAVDYSEYIAEDKYRQLPDLLAHKYKEESHTGK
ncbi:hypothetical protein, partial [Escherichia coli]|uniref:hypothetical protein n=3 Tax=Escherichia coli TaxID=562 RepID=UPI002025C67D